MSSPSHNSNLNTTNNSLSSPPRLLRDIQQQALLLTSSFESIKESLASQLLEYTELSCTTQSLYHRGVNELSESIELNEKLLRELVGHVEKLDQKMDTLERLKSEVRQIERNLDALEALI